MREKILLNLQTFFVNYLWMWMFTDRATVKVEIKDV